MSSIPRMIKGEVGVCYLLNSQVSDFSAPKMQDMKSRLSLIVWTLSPTVKQCVREQGENNHMHLTEMQFTLNISAKNVQILSKNR